jgi:copper(I)-binding protein
MRRWLAVILALVLALSLAACGDDEEKESTTGDSTPEAQGTIVVQDPWVRATAGGSTMGGMATESSEGADTSAETGMNTGAFMTLQNTSDTEDRLVKAAVDSSVARVVEIHETTVDENDVMQMRPVDGVTIPAGGSVELKPGGFHIMLMDVQGDLVEGQTVSLLLTFESGLELTVDAPVRSLTAMQ